MKKFIEKLIERLEEQQAELENEMHRLRSGDYTLPCSYDITDIKEIASESFKESIQIVNQLAEEYKDKVMINGQYCWQSCSATEHCKECNRLGNGSIDYYENYDVLAEEYNNGWIACSERLPNKEEYLKNDGRFIVTDGNRCYQSIYDVYQGKFRTLKFALSEWVFEEDKCVIEWQPFPELPELFKEEGGK